jgi:hypothetical protein
MRPPAALARTFAQMSRDRSIARLREALAQLALLLASLAAVLVLLLHMCGEGVEVEIARRSIARFRQSWRLSRF